MTTRPPAPSDPRISVCLTDATGEVVFERDAGRVHYAASTMKLAVLLAASRRIADEELSLGQELRTTRSFTGAGGAPFALTGDHLDPELPPPGTVVTLADLLEAMITRSSNEATNAVIELVGLPAVAAVAAACGAGRTRVERLIGDPAAVAAGYTNETTAADLTRLLRAVTTGALPDSPRLPGHLVDRHIDWLRRQTIAPIGAALPRGTDWGSKSGEVDGIRHDVAFVGDPRTDAAHYLAICTQGLGESAADEVIGTFTEALLPRLR